MLGFWDHLVQFFQNPEKIKDLIDLYEGWIYLILFVTIFSETGVLVAWFLPADTLLFAVGTIASDGTLQLHWLLPLLWLAAVSGDTVAYWLGRYMGPKVFHKDQARFLDKHHLQRAHAFYAKAGGRTVFFGRFLPVVRSLAPFVAGVGTMRYPRFLAYSAMGTVSWVGTFLLLGFFFGKLDIVQRNFLVVCIGMSIFGCLAILSGIIRQSIRRRRAAAAAAQQVADQVAE